MLEKQRYLGDLIRERVALGRLTSTGFYEQRCQLCNDHSTRAGWKITPEEVFYNCYNCHFRASYEEGSGKFNRWMREVCEANGISGQDLQEISATLFFNKSEESSVISLESLKKIRLHTPEIALPPSTHRLGSLGHDAIQEPLIEYLLRRRMDPMKFYFSLDRRHLLRVIIPYWRDGKIIFWQSRHIDNSTKPRYLNPGVSREAVIYGFDKLNHYSDLPLFVTEGVFDAETVDGICLLGSTLNAAKIELLKRTRRRIIFVIDADKNGEDLGQAVLREGWELTFVDPEADDVNDSAVKFGLPYTVYTLMKNATRKTQVVQSQMQLGLGLLEARLRRSQYA